MAFYNYPQTYQPYIPQTFNQPVQQAQPPANNGIIWVQGEAGAKSYLIAPNTTVPLWDSEDQVIYLKSADASGMPSMKVIDYTVRGAQIPISEASALDDKFIGREEFAEISAKIGKLEKELDKLKSKKE